MFGKKETFKYEVEVNALIREATNNLNQRVLALELQNNQLIIQNQKLEYELNNLRHTIYTDVQRLEKRITDFTDLWHPIMTENMNRIKAELKEEVQQAEYINISNIQTELEDKLDRMFLEYKENKYFEEDKLENKLTKIVEDYKAEKCVNEYVGLPEHYGISINLSTFAKKINDWFEINRSNDRYRSYPIKYYSILGLAYVRGVSITDNENNILIKGNITCLQKKEIWKLIFENDGYYKVYNYLNDNCDHIRLREDTTAPFRSDTIEIPMYHPYTPHQNEQYTSITLQTAIKHYDKIKRIVQNGGTIDHHLINNWN